jgi:hypothetical protein
MIREKGSEDTEGKLLRWFRASCREAIERVKLKIEREGGMRALMQEMINNTHLGSHESNHGSRLVCFLLCT